jgi:hypothetical protein
MGKESIRTLKNVNYNAKKKSSKKASKKSRKNRNNDPTTSDEMREILASESEVMPNSVSNFLGGHKSNGGKMKMYDPDMGGNQMPYMGMPQMGMPQMGMPQMGMPQMPGMGMPGMGGQTQMLSPANYDPIMLQHIAPVQSFQSMQGSMPPGLMTPSGLASTMGQHARGDYQVPSFQSFGGAIPSMTGGYLRRKLF